MQILLAAATRLEIADTADWLDAHSAGDIKVLITGVGSTVTAWSLTNAIYQHRPGLIIQAGLGGSFSNEPGITSVNIVDEEVFADVGARGENGWNDIFDLGLADLNQKPFASGRLFNHHADRWKDLGLPLFRGATVNRISDSEKEAQGIRSKYGAAIESMEGAALHYVCLQENVPFLQIRAISNYAGERNKLKWKMKEAIDHLNSRLKTIIADLIT